MPSLLFLHSDFKSSAWHIIFSKLVLQDTQICSNDIYQFQKILGLALAIYSSIFVSLRHNYQQLRSNFSRGSYFFWLEFPAFPYLLNSRVVLFYNCDSNFPCTHDRPTRSTFAYQFDSCFIVLTRTCECKLSWTLCSHAWVKPPYRMRWRENLGTRLNKNS